MYCSLATHKGEDNEFMNQQINFIKINTCSQQFEQ
jgi:hypothetical protein